MAGVSDVIKFQIDTTDVEFASTMMYQSRSAECKITNQCQIKFEYSWNISEFHSLSGTYHQSHKIPFTVVPSTGYIEAGHTTSFMINFAPEEVDDFTAILVCEIPFLVGLEPPKIPISAYSKRPICHIQAEVSDYLTANRRPPDYTFTIPLEMKVIEIFSKKVNVSATKKFDIINPTASPYEIAWVENPDYNSPCIKSDILGVSISGGKKMAMSFTYTPNSLRTIETIWYFDIPVFNVRIPILFVGRVMP